MNKAAKTPRSNCVLDTTKAEKAGIPNILSSNHSALSPLCTIQPIGNFLYMMKSLRALKLGGLSFELFSKL